VYEAGGLVDPDDDRSREADLERHLDREAPMGEAATVSKGVAFEDFPLEEALRVLEEADILVASKPVEETQGEDLQP